MNNERDIIMNTQPYAEDLGLPETIEREGRTLMGAGWERTKQDRWKRPDGQEFSAADATRVLNGQPALECGTSWPQPSA